MYVLHEQKESSTSLEDEDITINSMVLSISCATKCAIKQLHNLYLSRIN